MRQHASLTALRALTMSARHLQLVCATIVGPEQMAVATAASRTLGEAVPEAMTAQLAAIDSREQKP